MNPGVSSFSSPLIFRRSQDLSISSYLQLQCNASLATLIQWNAYQCSPIWSNFSLQLPASVITTVSELYLPALTLDYGTYLLTLTVAMAAAPQQISTASVYASITPSTITANLMPFGTSMITHGRGKDLLLDPGTYSVDPDAESFNASVSHSPIRNECKTPRFFNPVVELEIRLLLSNIWHLRFPHSQRFTTHHR